MTYVGVELANKAGEIVVLEVNGEKIPSELHGLPHDEAVPALPPRYHLVGPLVLHHLVRLHQERRRTPTTPPSPTTIITTTTTATAATVPLLLLLIRIHSNFQIL